MRTTLNKVNKDLLKEDNYRHIRYFKSNSYYIPSKEEVQTYSKEQIKTVGEINEKCSSYTILASPRLPQVETENDSQIEELKQLCRVGWKNILMPTGKVKDPKNIEIYKDRIVQELDVIEDADLSGYFLIVADYVNEFRRRGVLVGPGRGSAAGCLISYLMGITLIDPIQYGLIFSRFFNSARKGSLPDIDIDFPPDQRENVITYLKEKYGHNRVCQMLTFGRLQGRSALKEVLRVNESCSFDQMNDITNKKLVALHLILVPVNCFQTTEENCLADTSFVQQKIMCLVQQSACELVQRIPSL
jgi:DNA polymerase-3 subunit alpha